MISVQEIAEVAAEHWFSGVPRKQRTQERLEQIIWDAISNALIHYELGELAKIHIRKE